jgi:hypothetical protein
MRKEDLRSSITEYGEAIVTYRSQESKKLKYNVCTLDFSNDYIKSKQNRAKETDDTLLVFCWDVDAYRLLRAANVTTVVPLALALKRGDNGG